MSSCSRYEHAHILQDIQSGEVVIPIAIQFLKDFPRSFQIGHDFPDVALDNESYRHT